jgi:glycosyltransferase involved in cell wall biosynthesis
MKILLVSQFYAPEPNAKAPTLAHGLAARGHQVEVLTSFPSYPLGRTYDGYRQRPWSREEHDGVAVIRVPSFPDHSASTMGRVANYGSFFAAAAGIGAVLARRADVVWAYQPPPSTSYAGWVLACARRARFIFEIQDMWPDTLVATGVMRAPAVIGTIEKLMRFLYGRAAAISVISPGFKQMLIGKGVPAEKVSVIPNWSLGTPKDPVAPDGALAAREGLAGRFNILFAGVIGPAQDLDNVLEAAALLRDAPDIQFVVVGDGVDEPRLRAAAASRGLGNVRFLGRRPETEMPALFALADALLVHLKDHPLFRVTIPSKTLSYLASGRPIVSATAGDPAMVVEESGAGLTCPPGDPRKLADAVLRMARLSQTERDAMGRAGRHAYQTRYTPAVLLDRYEEMFERATRRAA